MHAWTLFVRMCILVCVLSSSVMTWVSFIYIMPLPFIAVIQGPFNSGIPFCFVCFGCRIEWKSKFAKRQYNNQNQSKPQKFNNRVPNCGMSQNTQKTLKYGSSNVFFLSFLMFLSFFKYYNCLENIYSSLC